jgi:hypothetical protein
LAVDDTVFHQNASFMYWNRSDEVGHLLVSVLVPRETFEAVHDAATSDGMDHEGLCLWCLVNETPFPNVMPSAKRIPVRM